MLPSVRKLNDYSTKFSHVFRIRYGERTKLKLHEIITYEIFLMRNITKLRYVVRARSSTRTHIYTQSGGECVYEIKTLHSNLAPEDGGGRIIEQVRYV